MDRETISDLVHRLNDVELALLLSLVAEGHCILTADDHEASLEGLQKEVELIGTSGFGLQTVIAECSGEMSVDDFVGKLLVNDNVSPSQQRQFMGISDVDSYFSRQEQLSTNSTTHNKAIANIVVIRDLNTTSSMIQAQLLELMRSKHVLTKRCKLEAPELFLVIVILPKTSDRPALMGHLLEQFFISHHRASDIPVTGEDSSSFNMRSDSESIASTASVIRKPSTTLPAHLFPLYPAAGKVLLPPTLVNNIRSFASKVTISTEIRRYLLDIVTFLRMHRAVKGGSVSAKTTKDFELLVKCLAPLHNLDFATPALVSLAVFKVYSHKIELVKQAKDERSTMWGSSSAEVQAYLDNINVEVVIEDVLDSVRAPL